MDPPKKKAEHKWWKSKSWKEINSIDSILIVTTYNVSTFSLDAKQVSLLSTAIALHEKVRKPSNLSIKY